MALIECPDCGKMFSEHAKQCPVCGCPISFAKKNQKAVNKPGSVLTPNNFLDGLNTDEIKAFEFINSFIKKYKNIVGKEYASYYGYSVINSGYRCFLISKLNGKLILKYRKKLDKNSQLFLYQHQITTNTIELTSFLEDLINGYFSLKQPLLCKSKTGKAAPQKEKEASFPNLQIGDKTDRLDKTKLKELQDRYRFAIRNNCVEEIIITNLVRHDNRIRVYFAFKDGSEKFCMSNNINNILFSSEYSAENRLRTGQSTKIYIPDTENSSRAYVIKNTSTNMYFSGFHKKKLYETSGREEHEVHGSFVIVDVADFSPDAYYFFSKESATELIKKLEPLFSGLVIEETLYRR